VLRVCSVTRRDQFRCLLIGRQTGEELGANTSCRIASTVPFSAFGSLSIDNLLTCME
jgi:hypothetical protein